MAGNIWIVAEVWQGRVSDISYELLALGRELAGKLGVKLEAILLGPEAAPCAGGLGKADAVLCCGDARLKEPVPEVHAAALTSLIHARKPRCVLFPTTNLSMGMGTLAAVDLGTVAIAFCKDVQVRDGKLVGRCVLYGGKIEADVAAALEPAIFSVLPGARPIEAGRSAQAPTIEEVAVDIGQVPPITFCRFIEPEAGDVNLAEQAALVAVGRGIQSQDNLELAQALADALGGAVCGSRPVIDQGWLPLSRQVGKSGLTVKPKVYIAAGISGAPEHVEGMKDAELIIAINSDPGAPIFNAAHYGIVADALDMLPALTEAVAARKS